MMTHSILVGVEHLQRSINQYEMSDQGKTHVGTGMQKLEDKGENVSIGNAPVSICSRFVVQAV